MLTPSLGQAWLQSGFWSVRHELRMNHRSSDLIRALVLQRTSLEIPQESLLANIYYSETSWSSYETVDGCKLYPNWPLCMLACWSLCASLDSPANFLPKLATLYASLDGPANFLPKLATLYASLLVTLYASLDGPTNFLPKLVTLYASLWSLCMLA